MPLPLSLRNPELAARLEAVHARAVAARGNLGGAAVGASGMEGMDATAGALAGLSALDAAIATAREAGTLPGSSGLDQLTHPDTKAAFEAAQAGTTELYARIGITTPTFTELAAMPPDSNGNRIDHAHIQKLAAGYEHMAAKGLQPELVLAPVLTKAEARALYAALTPERDEQGNVIPAKDKGIPNNPLEQYDHNDSDSDGLWINENITDAVWQHLHDQIANPLTTNDPTASSSHRLLPIYTDQTGRRWSLRVVAGTPRPTQVNVSHATHPHGNLSISEHLTLQATRIQAGTPPLDPDTWTWQNGTSPGGGYAPCGSWFAVHGQVCVDWIEVGDAGAGLGVRSEVG